MPFRHCMFLSLIASSILNAIESTVSYDTHNETCNNMALGFENGLFPNANITASSVLQGYWPENARLAGNKAWCPSRFGSGEYLEVRLGSPHAICAVATQGLHMHNNYTTAYKLQLSMDGSIWEWFNHGNGEVRTPHLSCIELYEITPIFSLTLSLPKRSPLTSKIVWR